MTISHLDRCLTRRRCLLLIIRPLLPTLLTPTHNTTLENYNQTLDLNQVSP